MSSPTRVTSREAPVVSGFLNMSKDAGATSMDVVRAVKRLTGQRKVGHGGTLDPAATGVLPICVGRATKFLNLVLDGHKQYTMRIRLGMATDTYDAAGIATEERDASGVRRDQLEAVLEQFRGEIQQVPPMYSALKREGTPLYKLARQGIEVEREPRGVTVFSLELRGWDPPDFVLEVECGRGFYARSLAHDLGRAVDNAAHLCSLARGQVGPFLLDEAISVQELEGLVKVGNWRERLHPIDFVLTHLPAVQLNPLNEERIRQGQPIRAGMGSSDIPAAQFGQRARIYSDQGEFVAVARYDPSGPWWRPEKVVSPV